MGLMRWSASQWVDEGGPLGAQRVPAQFSLCAGTCALTLLEVRVWSRVRCGTGVCVTRYWEY